jgi:tetratricopeptide (TPR) repeat protein
VGLAVELAGLLGRYWWLRGRVEEGLAWLDRAIAAARSAGGEAGSDAVAGRPLERALFWSGVLLNDAGRSAEANARLEASLALQREAGDDVGVARTLNSLGVVARSMGELDRAQALLEESIERKRALGDRAGIPVSLSNLGVVVNDRGDYETAVRYMSEALAIDEGLGGGSVVLSHANLGSSLIRAGRLDEGVRHLRLALPGVSELGDPELVIEVLTSLVRLALAASDRVAAHRAARLLLAADAVREREGLPMEPSEQLELDELRATVAERVPEAELEPLRAEATAIDVDAALSLAREALQAPEGRAL